MPYRDRRFSDRAVAILREKRHAEGRCVQCDKPTEVNPRRGTHYWLCPEHRKANSASKLLYYYRKKEEAQKNA